MSDIWDNVAAGLVGDLQILISGLQDTDYVRDMGSVIERAFAITLVGGMYISGQRMFQGMPTQDHNMLFLAPQVQVGDYRVDFVLGHSANFDKPSRCIIVECDGHDFHQKTKEQVERDRTRDRYLSTVYGRVIRFTGSELYRDPAKCAAEAVRVLFAAMDS